MAYDKHTWTCDEPITVERLNHIEDGIANAGGDCDCGFECEEDVTLLTEETVTTEFGDGYNVGVLSYSQEINADTIVVTFDGTEYECPRIDLQGNNGYGGWNASRTGEPDFSNYPFALISEFDPLIGGGTTLITRFAGSHTIKIETADGMTVTTTPCFDLARGYSCQAIILTEETLTAEANAR